LRPLLEVFALGLTLTLLCAAAGCCCREKPAPPEPAESEATPQAVVRSFARHLGNKEWKQAYLLLSKDTRKRYSPFQFRELFEKTIIGGLLFWQFATWNLAKMDSDTAAGEGQVTLRHPVYKGHERTFRLVLEPVVRRQQEETEKEVKVWRLKFTIAELLNMPDEDEESLFPVDIK
jgi:hypothetical protein